MSGELPPTYYFSGITFNPSFYPSSSTGDYLTETTAKKLFLTYPIAQGTETISTLNCSVINSSSEISNLKLGSNITAATISIGDAQENGGSVVIGNNNNSDTQIKGGTIKLMNNTNASGIIRSNYIDSLEFDSNLVIADTQTTGVLQIANSSSRNGDIEIAKNANNGILTLGSNSNEGTNICGNIINLTNDTTASGQFTSTGILSGTLGILSGGIAYQTTNTGFGIPTGINQNYYLYCTGTVTYTVVLPSVLIANQILNIRNGCNFTLTLMTTEATTKIYPNGTVNVFTFTWPTFAANATYRFFSNGTNWIGF